MEIQEVIDCLTNGVGEKPYCRLEGGAMKVFVADDQEFCAVSFGDIEDLQIAEDIAEAICEAGLMLKALQADIERMATQIDEQNKKNELEYHRGFKYGLEKAAEIVKEEFEALKEP